LPVDVCGEDVAVSVPRETPPVVTVVLAAGMLSTSNLDRMLNPAKRIMYQIPNPKMDNCRRYRPAG
jgi:hypothetical protein